MEWLVDAMTAEVPARRPTIEKVVGFFSLICHSLSESKLRALITSREDPTLNTTFLSRGARALRTVQNIVTGKSAVPEP